MQNARVYSCNILRAIMEVDFSYFDDTVKPVCNDHLYNKIYYLWFIQ